MRWGSVWLASERVAGGLVRAELGEEIKTEHARVGSPDGQGAGRVVGTGLAQLPQQPVDVIRVVVETGLAGGVTGQQGSDRVAGPGCVQFPQQQRSGMQAPQA